MAGTAVDQIFLTQIEEWLESSQLGALLGPLLINKLGNIISNYVRTASDFYGNSMIGFTAAEFISLLLNLTAPNPGGNILAASLYSTGITSSFTAKPLAMSISPPAFPPPLWAPVSNIVVFPGISTVPQWSKVFSTSLQPFTNFEPTLGKKMAHKYLALQYLMAVKAAMLSVTTLYTLVNTLTGITATLPGTIS